VRPVVAPAGIFERDGATTFVPTEAAVGPWDARLVHGAAIAALFAGQLDGDEGTLARLTVEILAPVPHQPLELSCSAPTGGRRVQRRHAELRAGERTVATATGLSVRTNHLELPPTVLDHPSPFDPSYAPALLEPNRSAAGVIGWESFDSLACATTLLRTPDDERVHRWMSLTMPVIAGTALRGVELAAVAADYAQDAVNRQLPYEHWSFRNAELTVHLARQPVGRWVGVRAESVVQPVGAGFNDADLFDEDGRVGRAASTIVVEHRPAAEDR